MLWLSATNNMSIDFLTFAGSSDYISNVYALSSLFSSFMIDITNLGFSHIATLPALSNGQSIYIQPIGTANIVNVVAFKDGSNNIYSNSTSYSSIGWYVYLGNTCILTYYTAGNNPWGPGEITGSWTFQNVAAGNYIPMKLNTATLLYLH